MSAPTSVLGFPFALYSQRACFHALTTFPMVSHCSLLFSICQPFREGEGSFLFLWFSSASVSAGTISLGLRMSPFQGSSPSRSPSCSSSSIMYPFPSPWSREFSYNLLQLQWVFSSALRTTFPPTSLDPRSCSYFFLTPLPLLVLSYWLLFYRLLTCSGPSQPNLFIKQSVLHEPIFSVFYLS